MDYEKLKKVELQNDNLSKFIEEWNYCLRYNTCTFSPEYLESTFLKQLQKCSSLKAQLGMYDYMGSFKGEERSYRALYELVEQRLELERRDKAKADLVSGPKAKSLGGILDTQTPGANKGVCR